MKSTAWLAGMIMVSLPVSADMFKCTDADGNVGFSDKPCPGQQQETLKESTAPVAESGADTATPDPDLDAGTVSDPDAIKPLAAGRKVTASSPLAKVYTNYLDAVRRCDRDEAMKYVSSKMAAEMAAAPDSEFSREACQMLLMFLPKDFKDATEIIEGDRGTIQWLKVESTNDGAMTSTVKFEQSEDFVRENGVWKLND